jgi:hypothetical protein
MVVTILSVTSVPHVRSSDPMIAAALADGIKNSPTIRRLVDIIDASNLIVYLEKGRCPEVAVSCLMMAGGTRDARYVRVNFFLQEKVGRSMVWHPNDLSIAIAHELQHAAEIAAWPDVVDAETLVTAYRRSGLDRGSEHLDTDAAIRAGEARREELRERRR